MRDFLLFFWNLFIQTFIILVRVLYWPALIIAIIAAIWWYMGVI